MDLLAGDKVIVTDRKLKDQLMQKGFGEQRENRLVLDLREALYLLEKNKIKPEDSRGKGLGFEEILKIAGAQDKKFYKTYVVYKDLRERGYVVKTGYKFGFDLRVYPRGKKPGEEHTQWVVHVSTQSEKLRMPEFSRMVRLAGNLKTGPLVAVVDSEDDINYYEIKRLTP